MLKETVNACRFYAQDAHVFYRRIPPSPHICKGGLPAFPATHTKMIEGGREGFSFPVIKGGVCYRAHMQPWGFGGGVVPGQARLTCSLSASWPVLEAGLIDLSAHHMPLFPTLPHWQRPLPLSSPSSVPHNHGLIITHVPYFADLQHGTFPTILLFIHSTTYHPLHSLHRSTHTHVRIQTSAHYMYSTFRNRGTGLENIFAFLSSCVLLLRMKWQVQ